MITIRPSEERGTNKLSWLDTKFTFSFDQYDDPKHVHFRSLRVINEDKIAPGKGFGMHPHRDMEILTWILDGAIEHRDNMGSGAVIRPGELQHMTAGSGVLHSEFNPDPKNPAHLLQIWIMPKRANLKPQYEQLKFEDSELRGGFYHVAGPKAPVTIQQDADLHIARLDKGGEAKHELAKGRHAWVQVAQGAVKLNGTTLKQGDGAAISDEKEIRVTADQSSEVLLFDLA
jgi:redox-sensitive bicupin YhaK (pirin superfamily)